MKFHIKAHISIDVNDVNVHIPYSETLASAWHLFGMNITLMDWV